MPDRPARPARPALEPACAPAIVSVPVRTPLVSVRAALLLAVLAGCSSSPKPEPAPAPAQPGEPRTTVVEGERQNPDPNPQTGFTRIVSGAGDSVGAIPGSSTAQ